MTPRYNNPDVPPVEGMILLAHVGDTDVYFVPVDPFPAITLVWGEDDWQWESDLLDRARLVGGAPLPTNPDGPYEVGRRLARARGLA